MERKKWAYTDGDGNQVNVRPRMVKILAGIDKYAKIVDVAIQHSPEIRLVYVSCFMGNFHN